MSYTVDLEADDLSCKSHSAAQQAAELINTDEWMRDHLQVSANCRSSPPKDDHWYLVIEHHDPCSWKEPLARRVWLRIAPLMADGATAEFRHEDGERFRIRWAEGRAYEEYPTDITWGISCELTLQNLEGITPCH